MAHAFIRFHGSYTYESVDMLEGAVAAARTQLDDDDDAHPRLAGLRCFIRHGTRLAVDVILPAAIDVRFVAANLFETLASHAVAGGVEVLHGAQRIDYFACGGDD